MRYTMEQQAHNRELLADYLSKLPEDYQGFEMEDFFQSVRLRAIYNMRNPNHAALEAARNEAREISQRYGLENGGVQKCGAVACAVGHGPSAGLFVIESELVSSSTGVDWFKYTTRVLLANETPDRRNAFEWMFGGAWSNVDNTPQGAAKRIRYYNAHGVPEGFDAEDFDSFVHLYA